MEKKKVPEIRLEGFEGEWESCELKEIATFSKGKGYSKADLVPAGNPIILYGRMYTNHEIIISDVDTFAVPKKNSVCSRGGEVIVPASGESAEDISVASVVKNPDILLGGDLNIISPNKNIDPAFLALVISYGNAHDDMAKMAHGKTVVHLHNDDLEQVQFIHPQYDEQLAISSYISSIDTVIKCQQERHTKLLALKKSLLQKMFPQKGESTPRIRFEGFDGEWEKKKLGDLYECNNERNVNKNIGFDKTISVATMNYKEDGNGAALDSLATYKILRLGDIAFEGHTNKEFLYGRFVLNDIGDGIMSPRFSALRPKKIFPISFWKYYIHHEPIMRKILVNSTKTGTMMNELDIDDFLEQVIYVPGDDEQKTIGEYFDNLDILIDTQEKKITKLQQMKTALLQKMFV
ncbi:restriction endonuclease subunit S [Selenomonas ruminantium]|uniref:restriction endonuclease subunit S n=1 Tax=Selenomonas ruminantium TaxID=971 RepID=UPI00040A5144|nr:restriction endonuclease subunit S [Selenomonas ruminantium]